MNINEHDRKEIKGCMKMKEELIQNNDSICIKRTIPLFSEEEIKNIDENFISIVNEYSKMLVKEKEQKIIQLLLKKQNEEIERLNKENKILKEALYIIWNKEIDIDYDKLQKAINDIKNMRKEADKQLKNNLHKIIFGSDKE